VPAYQASFLASGSEPRFARPSVLRSKTLKSTEFTSGDLSQIRGPRETWFRGVNWRDNPNAIQNFGYTQE